LGCFLSAYQNNTDLLKEEHPEILAGIGSGIEKAAFGVQKLSLSLSERRQDMTKITIEARSHYALSIGAKINDLR